MFRRNIIFVLSVVLIVGLPAISQDESQEELVEDKGWRFQQMPFNYQNIQVPRQLWEILKNILREDGASEATVSDFSTLPISVQVELASADPLVLKDRLNHRLLFIEGGGELDLFNYVTSKGSFNIRFTPQLTEDNPFHLLYISDSPGKNIAGDSWGNGCGKIYDLSEQKNQFILDQGISLTSSRRHYLHLMAGTFIIFQLVDDRLFLGYIRLMDSRYPQFKCRNV